MKKINLFILLLSFSQFSMSATNFDNAYMEKNYNTLINNEKEKRNLQQNPTPPKDCSFINVDFQLNYHSEPIQWERNKSVNELETIAKTYGEEWDTLGLYRGRLKLQGTPLMYIQQIGNNSFCLSIPKMNLTLVQEPTIYIAKESQKFNCTRSRIEQHELMHHDFSMNAIEKSIPYIKAQALGQLGKPIKGFSEQDVTQQASIEIRRFIETSQKYIEQITKRANATIDTKENYIKEAKMCDEREQREILSLVKSSRQKY